MTTNMMSNINKNKLGLSRLEQQYSSGKKIQRPSEDPIIAVRALKLRTNLSEIEQYYGKNIPDAMSWMNVTESSLSTVNEMIRKINTLCIQGSTDTLTAKDRTSVVENLQQYRKQIYQEGNVNYAGRYVFTGYKTDSSLIFNETAKDLSYQINEKFNASEIQTISKTIGSYKVSDFDDNTITFENAPNVVTAYRIQLSYMKLDDVASGDISYIDENGVSSTLAVTKKNITEADAYEPGNGDEIHFIPETGELILGKSAFEKLRIATGIGINYQKSEFQAGDLKPEHYFDCTRTDSLGKTVDFTKGDKQEIQYEVNYNQRLTINTEGAEAITHKVGRMIDDILRSVEDVTKTEEKIDTINNRLKDNTLSVADKKRYEDMLEQLKTELVLKKDIMQKTFDRGIAVSNKEQDRVNVAVADLGTRYVRLELIESRLSSQRVDFKDLMSNNEDVDLVDTIIRYNSAQTIYNASLNAASKVVRNTLLDFI